MRDSFSSARFCESCISLGRGCASVTWTWLASPSPFFPLICQKRRTLAISGTSSREGDLTAHTAKCFFFFLELTVKMSLSVRESFTLKCFVGVGERGQSLPCDSQTLTVVVQAPDSAIVLGLGLKALKSVVVSVCIDLA